MRPFLPGNPFESATRLSNAQKGIHRSQPLAPPATSRNPKICEATDATIVKESPSPDWSSVTLRTSTGRSSGPLRVGQTFAGRTITNIGQHLGFSGPAVWVETEREQCLIPLFTQSNIAAPNASRGISQRGPADTELKADSGIRKLADNEFQIDRRVVQAILSDPTALTKTTRLVPAKDASGHFLGLHLFGLRPGHLLTLVGLRNGDRLERINGFEIVRPEQALSAYARLSTAKQLEVRLTRAGRPLNLKLTLE